MKKIYTYLMAGLLLTSCGQKPVKVTLEQQDGKFELQLDGSPFYINGAGLEFGDFKSLAEHNGNSFRTWRTENGELSGKQVLDEAYKNGLMVTMGIEVARERHGFDYNDEKAVQEQLERIKKEVLELKDHPALMIWAIGNELNLDYSNPKVWDAVNEISEMIHQVDPNHLTTTTLAGISKREISRIQDRAGDLDLLSVQMYGDLPDVPKLIRAYGWKGAYMVTEWGATGHWEVPTTSWGAPIEENSTIKAANYLSRYQKGIAVDKEQCVGSYVFLWGNKQERTPTWYGIFLDDGKETESVDVMHYIWNGVYPENRTPQIKSYTLNGKIANDNIIVEEGSSLDARADIFDFEEDVITYRWEVLYEATEVGHGGDYEERPDAITLEILKENSGELSFKAPAPGNYRLFVYADDGANHAATANIPFRVE